MFKKYQHIERLGTTEVENILLGECFVFPKIDGTNGQVWMEDGIIKAGSRNRELSIDDDNAGFYKYVLEHEGIKNYLRVNPTHRLYGEFLVPHSLKTYREDAWRKFYVFDITVGDAEDFKYIPYNDYKELLEKYGIEYIPASFILKNGNIEQIYSKLDQNNFLIKDGEGTGEGFVIKNYDFINKYGRKTWAKLVTSEFKEKHSKEMGASIMEGTKMIEEQIVEKYCTEALVEKEYEKIKNEEEGWSSKMIPKLLGIIFYCLVKEECWNFVKEYKNPRIDFKLLQFFVIKKVKEIKNELF